MTPAITRTAKPARANFRPAEEELSGSWVANAGRASILTGAASCTIFGAELTAAGIRVGRGAGRPIFGITISQVSVARGAATISCTGGRGGTSDASTLL